MRTLNIILTAVVLSIAAPIRAHEACGHEPTVPSLRLCVEHEAKHGAIDNEGLARALLAQLDAAEAAVQRGQPEVAIEVLNAFVATVRAQAGIHIDPQHAAHMILHAEQVIAALAS